MNGRAVDATALDMLHLARRAWQRSQPQTFLEIEDASSFPATTGTPSGRAHDGTAPPAPPPERERRAGNEHTTLGNQP